MRFTAALVMSALVSSAAILAQPTARMTLTSGDTLDAQLVDLSAVGFTVRVGGNERQIPKNDVALIDFGGGAAAEPRELDNLGGQHLLVLRNGSVVRGELIDIGGASPLRLSVRTNGGERDFSSNDVARIYLRRPPASPPPPPAPSQPSQEGIVIRVQASQRWTATNISVRRGQTVRFEAAGEIELAEGGAVKSGPGGTSNRDAGAPMPSVSTGTLIGRVDPGRIRISANPFIIGTSSAVTMPNDGTLFLGVNDSQLIDNRGSYEVRISVR